MYCNKCGKQIDDEALICVNCGVATINMLKKEQQANQNQQAPKQEPIIINNNNSASSSAAASAFGYGRVRRRHSVLLDLFLIIITGGLWIIWMIVRPKYY